MATAKKGAKKQNERGERQKVNQVAFKYKFPETYNPVYTNGAYGGLTSQGEIALNFYIERQPIPYEQKHEVNSEGTLGPLMNQVPEVDEGVLNVIRYVTVGVIMNPDTAKRIYDFLGKQLNILSTHQQARLSGQQEAEQQLQ